MIDAIRFATERLTYGEAAEMVGVEPQTLRKWVMVGRYGFPKPIQIGSKRYFLKSEIDDWIQRRCDRS